jgi:septal ring factor EnvC (AmiA/AmiB activator)
MKAFKAKRLPINFILKATPVVYILLCTVSLTTAGAVNSPTPPSSTKQLSEKQKTELDAQILDQYKKTSEGYKSISVNLLELKKQRALLRRDIAEIEKKLGETKDPQAINELRTELSNLQKKLDHLDDEKKENRASLKKMHDDFEQYTADAYKNIQKKQSE